jgi:hypothetical protein
MSLHQIWIFEVAALALLSGALGRGPTELSASRRVRREDFERYFLDRLWFGSPDSVAADLVVKLLWLDRFDRAESGKKDLPATSLLGEEVNCTKELREELSSESRRDLLFIEEERKERAVGESNFGCCSPSGALSWSLDPSLCSWFLMIDFLNTREPLRRFGEIACSAGTGRDTAVEGGSAPSGREERSFFRLSFKWVRVLKWFVGDPPLCFSRRRTSSSKSSKTALSPAEICNGGVDSVDSAADGSEGLGDLRKQSWGSNFAAPAVLKVRWTCGRDLPSSLTPFTDTISSPRQQLLFSAGEHGSSNCWITAQVESFPERFCRCRRATFRQRRSPKSRGTETWSRVRGEGEGDVREKRGRSSGLSWDRWMEGKRADLGEGAIGEGLRPKLAPELIGRVGRLPRTRDGLWTEDWRVMEEATLEVSWVER